MARRKATKERTSTDRWPVIVLTIATIACLLPWVGKAFHVDDPLFVWTAQHIRAHPFDPYGFQVNWYTTEKPMSQVTQNPPLACYYIALASLFVGWREIGIHLFMIIPAVAVVLGTYQLAKRMCSEPVLAALITLLTPVFLISSTTVMCDVLMMAFWVWAMVFWLRGTETDSKGQLLISAVLVAAAAMTKYYGAALVLLLPMYSLLKKRKLGWWMLYMLVPVGVLGAYQIATRAMYGTGMLLNAAAFANGIRFHYEKALGEKLLIGLVFAGGCLLPILFYAPIVWSKKWLIGGLALLAATVTGLTRLHDVGTLHLRTDSGTILWSPIVQFALFTVVGLCALALAPGKAIRRRDPEAVLLGLWVLGTFLFASAINWSINGRSILPAAPAIGILIARAVEAHGKMPMVTSKWLLVPLLPAAVIGLWTAYADYALANAWRDAANEICAKYGDGNRTIHSQGHWGFQYYSTNAGAVQMDASDCAVAQGDVIVAPFGNTNLVPTPMDKVDIVETMEIPVKCGIATMQFDAGAGFYSESAGPLPFSLGQAPNLRIGVALARVPFRLLNTQPSGTEN